MYRIWFERPLPAQYEQLLDGVAVAIDRSNDPAGSPLASLPGAQAIVASARIR